MKNTRKTISTKSSKKSAFSKGRELDKVLRTMKKKALTNKKKTGLLTCLKILDLADNRLTTLPIGTHVFPKEPSIGTHVFSKVYSSRLLKRSRLVPMIA